jgi:hypothetical protein
MELSKELVDWLCKECGGYVHGKEHRKYMNFNTYYLTCATTDNVVYFFQYNSNNLEIKDNIITWAELKEKYNITDFNITKEDLKTGMVVKLRDGNSGFYININNCMKIIRTKSGYIQMRFYNDDLTYDGNSNWDIMEVRTVKSVNGILHPENDIYSYTIWEREELSQEQKELRELEKQQRDIADKIRKLSERIGG